MKHRAKKRAWTRSSRAVRCDVCQVCLATNICGYVSLQESDCSGKSGYVEVDDSNIPWMYNLVSLVDFSLSMCLWHFDGSGYFVRGSRILCTGWVSMAGYDIASRARKCRINSAKEQTHVIPGHTITFGRLIPCRSLSVARMECHTVVRTSLVRNAVRCHPNMAGTRRTVRESHAISSFSTALFLGKIFLPSAARVEAVKRHQPSRWRATCIVSATSI